MNRFVRTTGIAVAGLAAALVMSGCSSSDSKSSDASNDQGKGANTAAPAPSSSSGGGADGAGAKAGDIEGSWIAMTGGKSTALVIQGKQAAIAGQHVCTGVVAAMGKQMLTLKCPDGNNDRTMGTIDSSDGNIMKVSWEAGIKDTFRRTDGAKLPDGLKMPKP
ncbi:hypothetical protein OG372_20250 [Streptomyces sp. NBC_01020]|uniref:hypothetical protein n=1 Tax=unclassified Streptomyces TaxID=2593676 RepID=UPI002E1F9E4D|nr:hypothetical protein OG372_20250 [Streptomyces sp. NBC_01020]WSX43785.1 hypothetical protein OG760_19995 [Streptomyces sp. NBC_00963]WSX68179.1 hypothetical protein OG221_16950 [Streptomyces sp. NBC_00932]